MASTYRKDTDAVSFGGYNQTSSHFSGPALIESCGTAASMVPQSILPPNSSDDHRSMDVTDAYQTFDDSVVIISNRLITGESSGDSEDMGNRDVVVATVNPDIAVPIADDGNLADQCFPMMPTDISSRMPRKLVLPVSESTYQVEKAQSRFQEPGLPYGWERHTNPEGQPFFYCSKKNVITEDWIYDSDSDRMMRINQFVDFLRGQRDISDGPQRRAQLFVQLEFYDPDVYPNAQKKTGGWECKYYFADAVTRVVFWVERFPIGHYLKEVKGDLKVEHIGIMNERQYWAHYEHFCNIQQLTGSDWDRLFGRLIFLRSDRVTSKRSTVAWTQEELGIMISNVKVGRKLIFTDAAPELCWTLGRYMKMICHEQFVNFYGQYGARLNATDSVHGNLHSKTTRSLSFKICSPLLFYAPAVQFEQLMKTWVDEIMRLDAWNRLIENLIFSWKQYAFIGGILIASNVSFLTIPSIDGNPGPDKANHVARGLCSASAATALFSVVWSMMLILSHHSLGKTAAEAQRFLKSHQHPTRGLEPLAVLYSLPCAMLLWGMLFFLAAFGSMALHSDSVALALPLVICFLLVLWCVYTFQKPDVASYKSIARFFIYLTPSRFGRVLSTFKPTRTTLSLVRLRRHEDTHDVELQRSDSGQDH